MNKPTDEEIKAQAAKLTEIKSKVRRLTAFGDDNHEAIEAQVTVLNEHLDEDDIYDRWPDESDSHTRDAALQASQWMNGQPMDDREEGDNGDLASSWAELIG